MRKNSIGVHIEKNALVDEGDGVISFPNGQVIVDDSEMWSGYRYDIKSLDISTYKGQVTADHIDSLQTLIGKVTKFYKKGNKVLIDGIRFAVKESAMARLAYDLFKGGFLTDFSVETIGPWPGEDDRTYHEASLVGLSAVVVGNNKSATINQLVLNSLAQAKADGLDTSELEKAMHIKEEESQPPAETPEPKEEVKEKSNNNKEQEDMKFVTIKNTRGFAAKVSFKNAAGEDVETELADGASVDVSEDQKDAVDKQLADAKAPEQDVDAKVEQAVAQVKADHEKSLKAMQDELATFKEAFDKQAKEPEFRKPGEHEVRASNGAATKLEAMDWRERTALQLQSLYAAGKGNQAAANTVNAINGLHLELLQKEGKASNTLTLTDLGNFVIAPEMATKIEGHVSNYRPVLDRFNFTETMSLVTSWIERTGEIEMEDVDMEDHGDNEDLKPISQPDYTTHSSTLKEFAAVTPVDASAIRFSAADIVEDITSMYRTAYDRALAQSVIGRLEKAIESNGNSVPYNFASANGGDIGALVSLIRAWAEIAEHTPNGVYLMTMASYLHLFEMSLRAGITGPLATIFTQGQDGIPRFIGLPYVIVPGDLLPNLNTAATKSWTFEGVSVTVNHGVMLADPTNFKGRVSGGLNFQVSTEASYEENGTVKSAFQRDKVVFRGYGYRKSAITNTADVSGILAPGIS